MPHQERTWPSMATPPSSPARSPRNSCDMMRRNESAQANSVEYYILFTSAMTVATFAGVEPELVNRAGLVYTVAPLAYGVSYILVDQQLWSLTRSVAWWVGNISCLWLLRRAGTKLNVI
ncbi:hypothetical protein SUNI508_13995 [Seiridium unicorne]|uniref:Uncharacterized protein n=1 Tax=Seiridium unicorne TaxID=138068 RepID=A0ABR2V968_9PEZI